MRAWTSVRGVARHLRARWEERERRPNIVTPQFGTGPTPAPVVLMPVGRRFDQRKPDAMVQCREGYLNAFAAAGIQGRLIDWRDLAAAVARHPTSFAVVFGADLPEFDEQALEALRCIPTAVWVNPWFEGEERFFAARDLDARIWRWSDAHRDAVLEICPRLVFTATVSGGLPFFAEWERRGVPVRSLPLACDTEKYQPKGSHEPEFEDVPLAFVGGWWDSKGRQIERYLGPFADQLIIYGYNRWPWPGYRGKLARDKESALYRQATLCPVINEPTVALLHGQINERVFKVLGCGGTPIVDAVPAYAELFPDDELPVPRDEHEFGRWVRRWLADPAEREERSARARRTLWAKHTYAHRVAQLLKDLDLDPYEGPKG